jgi:hypothetical protein
MGLFGKKKDKVADGEDSSRSALFGSRKGKDSPAAQNPYAAPAADSDPYAQPPPSYSSAGGQAAAPYGQDKTPSVTGPGQSYGQRPGGFGAQGGSYGAQSGYGNDRFGGAGANAPPQRPGGYGGLGRTASNDTMGTEAGRNELFGNAPQRQQAQPPAQPQQPGGYGQSGAYGDSSQSGGYGAGASGTSGGYGAAPGGYGAYEDRQLTAEEQEEVSRQIANTCETCTDFMTPIARKTSTPPSKKSNS